MGIDEFAHESLQDVKSIAEYLAAIIQGLESGRIDLSDGGGQLVLHPAGLLSLEVRAKRRGNRARLQLELSWSEEKATGQVPADVLRIRFEADD